MAFFSALTASSRAGLLTMPEGRGMLPSVWSSKVVVGCDASIFSTSSLVSSTCIASSPSAFVFGSSGFAVSAAASSLVAFAASASFASLSASSIDASMTGSWSSGASVASAMYKASSTSGLMESSSVSRMGLMDFSSTSDQKSATSACLFWYSSRSPAFSASSTNFLPK